MASAPQLVVGLGNPGARYAETRHNAGFWFVDRLAARLDGRFATETRFHGEIARVAAGRAEGCWVLKPATFMNDSGRAVQRFIAYYDIPVQHVLIVHDEVDFPAGVARLKQGGGHGGHNGLRDVIACTGPDFMRLRLGVGHPGNKDEVVPYVLSRPTAGDRALIDQAIERSLDVMPLVLAGDFAKAMTALHTDAGSVPEDEEDGDA
ncbi:MAG TPA: aminoacyl-tRNA hydrolase [Gammaproteobacteria bacterium]